MTIIFNQAQRDFYQETKNKPLECKNVRDKSFITIPTEYYLKWLERKYAERGGR